MRRPFVIISSAISIDGKLACADRAPLQLSNEKDRREVDRLRSEMDAILVGSKTIANDNPSLTLKYEEHRQRRIAGGLAPDPAKVAISKYGNISLDSNFITKGNAEKIVFTTRHASSQDVAKLAGWAAIITSELPRVDIAVLLSTLYDRGIRKLMVEGGGETNATFMSMDMVDEIRLAIAPIAVGGRKAPTLFDGPDFCIPKRLKLKEHRNLGELIILRYCVLDLQDE